MNRLLNFIFPNSDIDSCVLQIDYQYDTSKEFGLKNREFVVMSRNLKFDDGDHFIIEVKKLLQKKNAFHYIKSIDCVSNVM